jgi:hypothetical protein
MSAMRRFALVAFLCAAIGCDPSAPPREVEQPVAESKPITEPVADFRKFVQAEIERLNAMGFATSHKFKYELKKTDSLVTPVVGILSVDVVRKGKPAGPHEVLNLAQRAQDSRAIATYRRSQGNPLATLELPPKKYTISEIAARTVFVIHLEMKYRPHKGTWVPARGNTLVTSAKGLEDKDIALDKYVVGQRYIAWRLEDLERLF